MQCSAAAGAALWVNPLHAKGINEKLNLAFIGLGGRANELLGQFSQLANTRVAALCDVDEERLAAMAKRFPGANTYGDLRKLLDDPQVDAVVIATCNHWHVLAAIWACQAGKDVYVEKPLGHNHWEGQQLVNAARSWDRIVQMGTQQRSDPLQADLKNFLHSKNELGAIQYVQVCRFGKREPIGKRSTPLATPKSINYNLWLGPATDLPIYREKLHYDWHWDRNTGNGEMGNWGVHVLDDAVNVVLRDRCPFPKRIAAAGGRMVWNDAGNTPNVGFAIYDTGSIPVLFGLSNLADGPKSKELSFAGVGSGYVIHCDGGYYAGGRGGGAAYDQQGKRIRKFKGDSGKAHQGNFVEAVLSHDRGKLNTEVEIGHQSTAWCNLADVAMQLGHAYNHEQAVVARANFEPWSSLIDRIEKHLATNGIDPANSNFQLGPLLEFDGGQQKFVGEHAAKANPLLRREYRKGFEVPEVA